MRGQSERGFSLLEMLAVVTILMILGAMATPSLLRAIRHYRLESSTRQIGDILKRTRYEAMRRNQRISTVFKPPAGGGSSGGELGIDYNMNGALDTGEPRALVTPELFLWIYPGTFTGWGIQGPDYINVTLGTQFNFGPDGILVEQSGGSWQISSTIHGVYLHTWPDPRCAVDPAACENYIVTVTPAGRVRLWNLTAWGYQAMQ